MSTALNDNGLQFFDGSVLSTVKQLGLRNKLINGNFGINQRGVSGSVVLTAGQYGHDRFKAGAAGCTYTFATVNNVTTLTISAGALQQVVEGLSLQSGVHVASWSGTAQARIDAGFGFGAFGASGAVAATATGGTNLIVEYSAGTLSLAQLEVGTGASLFEQRVVGMELMLCQRYYEIQRATTYVPYGPGGIVNILCGSWAVPKRTTPTILLSSVAQIDISSANGNSSWYVGLSSGGGAGNCGATITGISEL